MEPQRFGDLQVRVSPQRAGVPNRGLVVLLHGYGAPGTDLVPLARQIAVPPGVRFAFPEAPLVLSAGYDSRAWWQIDLAALEAALASGASRDRTAEEPEGLEQVSAQLEACLDELQSELGLAGAPLVLGGFSQGAMLACDIAARSQRELSGLLVLSGTLLAAPRWSAGFKRRPGLPVLQSHGRNDPLLAYSHAEQLKECFEAAGAAHTFLPFNGQHELPHSLLGAAGTFLSGIFPEDADSDSGVGE